MVLEKPDANNIRQVWMIEEVQKEKWEIVHGISALVLENMKSEMKLEFGKWRWDQLFYMKPSQNNKNEFWIQDGKDSLRMIHFS